MSTKKRRRNPASFDPYQFVNLPQIQMLPLALDKVHKGLLLGAEHTQNPYNREIIESFAKHIGNELAKAGLKPEEPAPWEDAITITPCAAVDIYGYLRALARIYLRRGGFSFRIRSEVIEQYAKDLALELENRGFKL